MKWFLQLKYSDFTLRNNNNVIKRTRMKKSLALAVDKNKAIRFGGKEDFGKAALEVTRHGRTGTLTFKMNIFFFFFTLIVWKDAKSNYSRDRGGDMNWGSDTRVMDCKLKFLILKCWMNHPKNKGKSVPSSLTGRIYGIWNLHAHLLQRLCWMASYGQCNIIK